MSHKAFTISNPEPVPKSHTSFSQSVHGYISAGVVCHAIMFLKKVGIIDILYKNNFLEPSTLTIKKKDRLMLDTSLKELEVNGILSKFNKCYNLTIFGKELLKYMGLIYYIYNGYSKLFSNFFSPYSSKKNKPSELINDEAVILGSDSLAQNFINPFIVRHVLELDISEGTICDLGCGDCSRLLLISKITKLKGIGIEISDDAIRMAKKTIKGCKNLKVIKGDIRNLKNSYPDVQILFQTMVMHDFSPESLCLDILNSFRKKFPNLQYFFYCDIVATSDSLKSQLPGFDYIHAMQGIRTRTYEDTMEMFAQSNFDLVSENPIEDLPNTFLWVLKPKEVDRNT